MCGIMGIVSRSPTRATPDAADLVAGLDRAVTAISALPADVDRARGSLPGPAVLRDPAAGLRRARAAALVTLAHPGSVYVYQGDELGLPEVWDLPTDVLDDPVWHDSGHTRKGRDGCRVPLPWEPAGPSLGFGDAEPWLPQPPEFAALSVARQETDPGSTLNLYWRALDLRRRLLGADRRIELLDVGPDVLAFRRNDDLTCVVNMGVHPIAMPTGEVLLASDHDLDDASERLPPDAAVWVR